MIPCQQIIAGTRDGMTVFGCEEPSAVIYPGTHPLYIHQSIDKPGFKALFTDIKVDQRPLRLNAPERTFINGDRRKIAPALGGFTGVLFRRADSPFGCTSTAVLSIAFFHDNSPPVLAKAASEPVASDAIAAPVAYQAFTENTQLRGAETIASAG